MKTFARFLLTTSALLVTSCDTSGQGAVEGSRLSVTALINEPIMPIARGEKYGEPLDAFLQENGMGEVVGAGTALAPSGGPAWVEIVIELRADESAVDELARKLADLGAPAGSHLVYYLGQDRHQVPIE